MAKLGISTGTVPDDGTGDSLIAGAVKINSNFDEIYNYFGDGNNLSFSSGLWQSTGSGINTTSNVGLGTTNPRFALEVGSVGASGTSLWVNGDARVTGILTVGTASITIDGSSNKITVGTGVTIDGSTGIISATSIVLDGTTLTGAAVTYITAGSGISVDQNTGNVTISATGGGGGGESYWTSTAAGIHTLSNVGIGTTNPTSSLTVQGDVSVSGVSTFSDDVNFIGHNYDAYWDQSLYQGCLKFKDNASLVFGTSDDFRIYYSDFSTKFDGAVLLSGALSVRTAGAGQTIAHFGNWSGVGYNVELYYDGNKKFETLGAGVTVTGTTFTNQLSVSGVGTFIGSVNFGSQLSIGTNTFQSILQSSSGEFIIRNNTGRLDLRSDEITLTTESGGSPEYAMRGFVGGAVELYYDGNKKFETTGVGVTVTGTTFTNQLNVSGVSTLGIVTGATYYGDTSNAVDGRWTLGANGTSDYTFTGIGFTQTTNDPVLYLARGGVYEFVNNSGGSHPFEIRQGYSGSTYSDGVVNNGAATGTIRFEVPFDAPNTLYYQCQNHAGMGATIYVTPRTEPAVGVRTTVSATTGSIGVGSTTSLNINGFKSYSLLKVGISSAAWVVLYTDSNSRTNDESRSYLTDPTPGSGVIAEVRTTSAGISTFLMSPGIIGWNNDVSVGSTIYAKVTNNESSSATITVDLTVVKLED